MALEIFDQSDEWSESGPDKNIALKLQVFQVIQVIQVCPGLSWSVFVCLGLSQSGKPTDPEGYKFGL